MTNATEISECLGDRWSVIGKTVLERKPEIVSTCSCGLKYTISEFGKLSSPAGNGEITDMRGVDNEEPSFYWNKNCSCNSTILVPLDKNREYYNGDKNGTG